MSKIRQFVTFYLDDSLFGIDIRVVHEVNPNINIMPVPLSEAHICGLVNIRGQVVLVMDIKTIFNKRKSVITEKSHMIILKTRDELSRSVKSAGDFQIEKYSDRLSAFIVDMIGEVITVKEDEIESPTYNMEHADSKFITGVVQLKNQLLIILKPVELLWYNSENIAAV